MAKPNLLRGSFTFSPDDIDAAADFVSDGMAQLGLDRKEALRRRLSVEEVLLNWQGAAGLDGTYTVELSRRLGRVGLALRCAGGPQDPLAAPEDDSYGAGGLGRSALENLGLALSWQYRDGVNLVSCSQRAGKPHSQLVQVLFAAALALVLGSAGTLLPQAWKALLLDSLLNPVFNTFLGLFSCIVGPMMFLAMVWGIVNIGDARQLGVIGRKLLGRFLVISSLFGLVCMGAALVWFRPALGGVQSGQTVFQSIVEMVMDIVPGNIVEPFLSGNTLQILFLGAVVGVVMILLRDRMQVLGQVVEQSNAVVQFILSAISAMVPAFIFLSVLRLMLQGTLARSAAGLFRAVLLSVALTAVEVALETLSLTKLGLSPAQAVKKLGPSFLIALTTASSAAAFPSMMECCRDKLGIDEKLTNFALPFGSVVFMPHAVNLFILVPLFAAQTYGVELTAGSLVLCVVNAVVLSVAAPPIPGGAISCYTLMFLQLGIPLEAISLAAAANVVLDFTATAGQLHDLLVQLTHGAGRMGLLDRDILLRD